MISFVYSSRFPLRRAGGAASGEYQNMSIYLPAAFGGGLIQRAVIGDGLHIRHPAAAGALKMGVRRGIAVKSNHRSRKLQQAALLGHLVEVADVAELFENKRHPYTQSLMSAAPVADPKKAAASKRILLEGDVPSPMNPPSGCPFRTRCRYATEECAAAMPPLRDIGNNHQVACYNML